MDRRTFALTLPAAALLAGCDPAGKSELPTGPIPKGVMAEALKQNVELTVAVRELDQAIKLMIEVVDQVYIQNSPRALGKLLETRADEVSTARTNLYSVLGIG